MCPSGLPDIYTLSPWAYGPQALGTYIRQTTRAHGITIKLEVKINFEFTKGVGIAIKSKETSS